MNIILSEHIIAIDLINKIIRRITLFFPDY